MTVESGKVTPESHGDCTDGDESISLAPTGDRSCHPAAGASLTVAVVASGLQNLTGPLSGQIAGQQLAAAAAVVDAAEQDHRDPCCWLTEVKWMCPTINTKS